MAAPLRSARFVAVVAGSLATALMACSLLNGLDADYTLRPATEGGKGDDPDSSIVGDAGNDTKVAPDSGQDSTASGTFCQLNGDAADVAFCCDFEKTSPSCEWDITETTHGSFVVDDQGKNNSQGLHAIISNPPTTGSVLQGKTLAMRPFSDYREHHLSFAFSLKSKSALYTASIGALGFAPFKVAGASVYNSGATDSIDISDPPGSLGGTVMDVKKGEWRLARIDMKRADAGTTYATTISVTNDIGTLQVVGSATFNGSAAATQVLVGAFFTTGSPDGGVETEVDDILLTQTK